MKNEMKSGSGNTASTLFYPMPRVIKIEILVILNVQEYHSDLKFRYVHTDDYRRFTTSCNIRSAVEIARELAWNDR